MGGGLAPAPRAGQRGRAAAVVLAAALLVAPALAAEPIEYVTVRDRLMCRTAQALRDGLRAIDARDKQLMSTIDGCHISVDGIPATVLQDNISRIKIRLRADGEQADMWTVPETIRPVRREPD